MNPVSKYTIGVRFGLITGLLYAILLFFRYKYFASNPLSFGVFTMVSYTIILMMYLLTGIFRKKELGGYAEFKEVFQSIFIAILITEAAYIVFNLVYLKYVDPSFWTHFKTSTLNYLEQQKLTSEQIDQQMKGFKDVDKQTEPMGLLKGYGVSVILDSIFGLIFAAIIRRKKPTFDKIQEEIKL